MPARMTLRHVIVYSGHPVENGIDVRVVNIALGYLEMRLVRHVKWCLKSCANSRASDQTAQMCSLIRVFSVCIKNL